MSTEARISAYRVIPDARREPVRVEVREVQDTYRTFGLAALRAEVRSLLALRLRGRATTPYERAALAAWLDVATEEHTQRLYGILKAQETPQGSTQAAPNAAALCASCRAPFERPTGSAGRPRSRCYVCSPPRR